MNKKLITEKLLQAISSCEEGLQVWSDPYLEKNIKLLHANLSQVACSFCGSWIGYHANVYYKAFEAPEPGDHFDPEWGLTRDFGFVYTSDNWIEYKRQVVFDRIFENVDSGLLEYEKRAADKVQSIFDENCEQISAIAEILWKDDNSDTLSRIKDDIKRIKEI